METKIQIHTETEQKDFFPALFANKDNSIIIFADAKTSDKTFSGLIIHSTNAGKNGTLGMYSTGWTYAQFTRLPKGSVIKLTITQKEGI